MKKRTTIYDIAEALDISTATVNRALTGKPRVSDETRALVLKTAEEMGFKPNSLARSLARRDLRLAVVAFTSFPEFHGPFLRGARDAEEALRDFNIQVDYFNFDQGASNTPQADRFLQTTLTGIALGGYDGALILARQHPALALMKERGVRVATAVNDVDRDMRQFCVNYNGRVAGRVAAELIYRLLPEKGMPVAIASGWPDMGIHKDILDGFTEQLARMPVNLTSVYYNHDNEEIAYRETLRILNGQPGLGAIYVNSFNSLGVMRAVEEKGLAGKILLITSDIYPQLRERILTGEVVASIFQNQYQQGRMGLETLYRVLANGDEVPDTLSIDPQIIFSSNLSLFD